MNLSDNNNHPVSKRENLSNITLSQEDPVHEEYVYYSEGEAPEDQNPLMSEGSNQPQNSEIEDYARFLGMNPVNEIDKQLLWIAKQGLLEPVPHPW